jgi:DNA repair exonuclease SbcCD ATPase subunit
MKLENIKGINWKILRELEIKFDPSARIIVLNAYNGRGKSSFIDGIGSLLHNQKGKSSWGGPENITYGQERAQLTGQFITHTGTKLLIDKKYSRKSSTKSECTITTPEGVVKAKITHNDRIRENIEELTGESTDVMLPLMIATQGDIPALLYEDPSVREKRLLSLLNLEKVNDAVDRLRSCLALVTIEEGLLPLKENLELQIKNICEQTTTQETEIEKKTTKVLELTPYEIALKTWEKLTQEKAEKDKLIWTLQTHKTSLNKNEYDLLQEIQKYGFQTSEEVPTQLKTLNNQLKTLASGVTFLKNATKAEQELTELEKTNKTVQELIDAGIVTDTLDQMVKIIQDTTTTLEKELLEHKTQLKLKTELENELETIKLTKTQLTEKEIELTQNEIETNKKIISVNNEKITQNKIATTQVNNQKNVISQIEFEINTQEVKLKKYPEDIELKDQLEIFETNKQKNTRLQLINETLAIWGQPNAVCPISHVRLEQNDTLAHTRTLEYKERLENLPEVEDPSKKIQEKEFLKNKIQECKTKLETEKLKLSNLEKTANSNNTENNTTLENNNKLLQTKIEESQLKLTQDTTNKNQILTKNNQLEKLIKEIKIEFSVKNTENEITDNKNQLQEFSKEVGMISSRKKQHTEILPQFEKLTKIKETNIQAIEAWNKWKNNPEVTVLFNGENINENSIAKNQKTITEQYLEQSNLNTKVTQYNNEINRLQVETKNLELKIENCKLSNEPTVSIELAKEKTDELTQQKADLKSLQDSQQLTKQQLSEVKKQLEEVERKIKQNEKKINLHAAINKTAELLNYKNLPRKIVGQELDHLLTGANYVLEKMGRPIELHQKDFVIGATCYKPGFGQVTIENAKNLSGGEKTITGLALRIAALKRLAPNLRCLILDEPSTHLDAIATEGLTVFLNELKGQLSHFGIEQIIIVDHNPKLADIADQIISW